MSGNEASLVDRDLTRRTGTSTFYDSQDCSSNAFATMIVEAHGDCQQIPNPQRLPPDDVFALSIGLDNIRYSIGVFSDTECKN
jgi:hypothetical protein